MFFGTGGDGGEIAGATARGAADAGTGAGAISVCVDGCEAYGRDAVASA